MRKLLRLLWGCWRLFWARRVTDVIPLTTTRVRFEAIGLCGGRFTLELGNVPEAKVRELVAFQAMRAQRRGEIQRLQATMMRDLQDQQDRLGQPKP